jgi:hypothetical protein
MAQKPDEFRKQAIDLWKKTVAQLDEISKNLMKTSRLDRLKFDRAKLIEERDKLVKRLGEETYKLIEKGRLSVPKPLQDLYKRISKVAERIIPGRIKPAKKKAKRTTSKKKTTAKTAAKKKATKKRKVTKKKATPKASV